MNSGVGLIFQPRFSAQDVFFSLHFPPYYVFSWLCKTEYQKLPVHRVFVNHLYFTSSAFTASFQSITAQTDALNLKHIVL